VEWVVQVNGKRRDSVTAPRDVDRATIEQLALQSDGAVRTLAGRAPKKVIVVAGRLVNIVG